MKIKIKAIGNHNKPTIPVIVYDKENNIVGEYNSISEAADILNVHQNNICHMLNGRLKSTGGYIFKRRNN